MHECIASIKQYVNGFSRLYVVANDGIGALPSGVVRVEESNFTRTTVDGVRPHVRHDKAAWYYQQLLKLHAHEYIPNLTEYYLIVDADVVFRKPVDMFDAHRRPLYAYGSEHHRPYFVHMNKLLPGKLYRKTNVSGICHHMMFHAPMLRELMALVEEQHKRPFWQVFINSIDPPEHSGASEYEIYFNFMNIYHPDTITIRRLDWANCSPSDSTQREPLDFVAKHSYCP